jgi:hypothetical protein
MAGQWIRRLNTREKQLPARWRTVLVFTVLLGVFSTTYDLFFLRTYSWLQDVGLNPVSPLDDHKSGSRMRDIREAYEWINRNAPAEAIVQQNTDLSHDTLYGVYCRRATALIGTGLGGRYGGSTPEFDSTLARLRPLFKPSGASFDSLCRQAAVDIVLIKDTDPVWNSRESWVWSQPAVFQNERVRVYRCTASRSL